MSETKKNKKHRFTVVDFACCVVGAGIGGYIAIAIWYFFLGF